MAKPDKNPKPTQATTQCFIMRTVGYLRKAFTCPFAGVLCHLSVGRIDQTAQRYRGWLEQCGLWVAQRQGTPTRCTLDPNGNDGVAFARHFVELRIARPQQALSLRMFSATMQNVGLTTQHQPTKA